MVSHGHLKLSGRVSHVVVGFVRLCFSFLLLLRLFHLLWVDIHTHVGSGWDGLSVGQVQVKLWCHFLGVTHRPFAQSGSWVDFGELGLLFFPPYLVRFRGGVTSPH